MSRLALFGVQRSALGQRWEDRLDDAGDRSARAIAQTTGLPDTLARLLAGRGVAVSDVTRHLDPTIRGLMPDPSGLVGMDAAAERLARAVRRREEVAIFGDYDVDGATSAALLGHYLRAHGVPFRIHIPDRITEGYGPNVDAIAALAEAGATLLVAVDCGTSSHAPFEEARRRGMDVVVLDHHQAPADLPAVTALVNPNRQDDLSGLGHLAACGVVFMALVALNRQLRREGAFAAAPEPDLLSLLDLVALGTVADVVPLTGLNRAFVRQGLQVMRGRSRVGLAALMDAAGLRDRLEAHHLGFLLGPRINAGGRIGDATLGARLLLLDDQAEAERLAIQLDRLNRERQVIEQQMLLEAEAEADAGFDGTGSVLVGAAGWHPGVVGLVAARLKERLRQPAFAIAWSGEDPDASGTGSARSVPGVDVGRIVRAAVDAGLASKGGGHAMAAGVTLRRRDFAAFGAFVRENVAAALNGSADVPVLSIDATLTAGAATPALATAFERAGPFGQGNPEPLFALGFHRVTDLVPVGDQHLRLTLAAGDGSTLGAMAFRSAGQPLGLALTALRGQPVHAAGTMMVDRWGGRERVSLRLVDVAPASA